VTRRAKCWVVVAVILCMASVSLGVVYLLIRPPADLRAFGAINREWNVLGPEADFDAQNRLAERCLDVSRQFPATTGGISALLLAASNAPKTPAGQDANRQFAQQIETTDLGVLASAFKLSSGRLRAVPQFAAPLLARVRRSPDHPQCGQLLAECCAMTNPWHPARRDEGEPPAVYQEAADLLADRYAGSPDIRRFPEGLAGPAGGSPPWAGRYERHLRAILEANRDRAVRCAAHYTLASVVLVGGEDRQDEAETLLEQFCAEFDGTHAYHYQGVEQVYLHTARTELKELQFHATGKPASEIVGVDLNGRPLKLSDYHGRVVLLNFWGTWCFPCMKLVPHERELAAAYRSQPFDILGVNCDDEVEKARAAAARTGMTWRSFRNQSGDRPAITKEWNILGYPTLYLIDHHGTIRKRWVGSPPPDELGHMVKVLVDAAEKGVSAKAMKPVISALTSRPAPAPAPLTATGPAPTPRPGTGFVDKVYRGPNGSEAEYTVFVPLTYDGSKPLPAILYLHGSGSRGADGRARLTTGLAKSVRDKNLDFPFLVIFPQAREGEDWLADKSGARRALAILAQAEKDYRIDPDHVALTGVSMGAAGTWSLAAADPNRWSAIVPISHGGDTASAAKLVGLPCWCFHGAADRIIPPHQSREMVEAITKAGGRPLYQEFPGVGHNDCADHVYAMNDLYEWLFMQNRSGR
jgi:thiol-disulfide isomerase/thioredoxin/predicted esterase